LRESGEQNIRKTHYAVQQVRARTRHAVLFSGPRFNEFVVQVKDDYASRTQRFLKNRIIPGLHLAKLYPELSNSLLVCVTETTSRDQIDALVKGLE
jgi:glycine dehydrogenase subunit 1